MSTSAQALEALNWRYATKRFDSAKKIPADVWQVLEESLRLSPSSLGMQPWKFFVVTEAATRSALRKVAFDQPQLEEASHLVVIASKNEMTSADVDRWIDRVVEVRGSTREAVEGYRQSMLGFVNKLTPGLETKAWTSRQCYIALGFFLSTAASLGIDACPMEGFNNKEVDEILGIDKLGFGSVVMATAGYRSATDKYASIKKARFSAEDVIVRR